MKTIASDSIVEFHTPTASINRNLQKARNTVSTPDLNLSLPSVVIGRLTGFENGQPMVNIPANPWPDNLPALTGIRLSPTQVGQEVILAFANGDPKKPVILNLLVNTADNAYPSIDVQVDGERLRVTAKKEIVLRCGEASITLTAAGKVLLKGTYVLSKSSGYNKIKGAAVDIN